MDELARALSRMSAADFQPVTTAELKKHIARLPINSAAGASGIHNMLLRKLPEHFIWLVVHLVNLSLASSSLQVAWKHAVIVMLPKTKVDLHEPSNYRPISLLCCLGKLCERVVQGRLYSHLEAAGLLTPQQSGFRRFRRAADNILFLTQKVQENLNKHKKVCCFFFDIKKAFDNVWHAGLLWKLVCAGVPAYLLLWTAAFLAERVFQVRVNGALSHHGRISADVPQGAVLSPTLFNVFVNDIPLEGKSSLSYSTLHDIHHRRHFSPAHENRHTHQASRRVAKKESPRDERIKDVLHYLHAIDQGQEGLRLQDERPAYPP